MAATGQSRRRDHETTVDHALIRGLVTAEPDAIRAELPGLVSSSAAEYPAKLPLGVTGRDLAYEQLRSALGTVGSTYSQGAICNGFAYRPARSHAAHVRSRNDTSAARVRADLQDRRQSSGFPCGARIELGEYAIAAAAAPRANFRAMSTGSIALRRRSHLHSRQQPLLGFDRPGQSHRLLAVSSQQPPSMLASGTRPRYAHETGSVPVAVARCPLRMLGHLVAAATVHG